MNPYKTVLLSSADELRAHASAWDDLWQRSSVYLPTARAEPLAVWLETFARSSTLRAIAVFEGTRLVGALPLVERRLGRMLRCGAMPFNEYGQNGDLAIDADADAAAVVGAIVEAIRELGLRLLWLEGIDVARPNWQLLQTALGAAGATLATQEIWTEGIVDIAGNFKAYEASRSRNLRRQIKRAKERLDAAGGGTFEIVRPTAADDLEALLRRGFEAEDRSWKASSGTSILRCPDVFEFYCRQARALVAGGNLELIYLGHAGETIAFEYGLSAKGWYLPVKIGYDERFSQLSPGHLIRGLAIEQFHRDPARVAIDFGGPLVEATVKWATRSFSLSRLLVALGGPMNRSLVRGYGVGRPALRRLRDRLRRRPTEDVEDGVRPLAAPAENKKQKKSPAPEPLESTC